MARIGIIENGIVKNIIVGDSNFAESYGNNAIILTDDIVKIGYAYDGTNFSAPIKSQEELETEGRAWRDLELRETDFIVPLTDYPNHAQWLTYRQQLRDWPTTDNFPNTKPTRP
tara:strand:- start:364 stop:705 length:342 start_codon:yes stop_codon:yes gene_type:complete